MKVQIGGVAAYPHGHRSADKLSSAKFGLGFDGERTGSVGVESCDFITPCVSYQEARQTATLSKEVFVALPTSREHRQSPVLQERYILSLVESRVNLRVGVINN